MFSHWQLASANALRLCLPCFTVINTHTEIHDQSKRALPGKVCMYRHAIMPYKLMSNDLCEDEFVQLNFQLNDNPRQTKLSFFKRQNYDVGKNILLNIMFLIVYMVHKCLRCNLRRLHRPKNNHRKFIVIGQIIVFDPIKLGNGYFSCHDEKAKTGWLTNQFIEKD